ncbi:hypothetical protein [Streptomyces sp. NPDC051636]|uniref:hypothetical protein n=1 Tax=Streptomyces sp. NPDC051636 TaxID=3365663 RepID=UPI00379E54E2
MSDTTFRRAAAEEVSFARWSAQALAVARDLRVLPSRPTLPAIPEQTREDAEIEALAVHLGILAPHPAAPSRPTAAGGAR